MCNELEKQLSPEKALMDKLDPVTLAQSILKLKKCHVSIQIAKTVHGKGLFVQNVKMNQQFKITSVKKNVIKGITAIKTKFVKPVSILNVVIERPNMNDYQNAEPTAPIPAQKKIFPHENVIVKKVLYKVKT